MEKKFKKERFQFVLTINDNIICQRYFRIPNFKDNLLNTIRFKESIDSCVRTIQNDLESKTRMAGWYIYDENYVKCEDKEPTIWDVLNEEFRTPIGDSNTIKFSFLVDEQEFMTRHWSGDVYPSYVRNSIDITNKKYKYDGAKTLDVNSSILQRMCIDKNDLVYVIIDEICSTFVNERENNHIYENLSIATANYRLFNKIDYSNRKKTREYLKTLY